MTIERLLELLTSAGTTLGVELQPDENGQCCVRLNKTFDVFLDYDFGSEWLQVYCLVGCIGDGEPEAIYSTLLEGNLFWAGTEGATLGLAPDDGSVYLCDKKPLDALGAVEFQAWLETFLHTAERYRTWLDASDTSPGAEEDQDDLDEGQPQAALAEAELASRFGNGFVRP